MDKVSVQQVIICTKSRRGDGKLTPIRVVKEVFELDGTLIAEDDPCSFTLETILAFIHYRFEGEQREKASQWAMNYFNESDKEQP